VIERRPLPYDTFELTHRAIDGRLVRLGYALRSPSDARVDLEETLEVPPSLGPLASADDPAVARLLAALHLVAGASYWKTCLPARVVVSGAVLSEEDAALWNRVYTAGLAEFFYRNGIDPSGLVPFTGESKGAPPARAEAKGSALLLWGGGKDSVVSHEALREGAVPHDLLTIGRAWDPVQRSAAIAGATHHLAKRTIDPKLFELNTQGAWNGHVPVSAYLAFAGLLLAALTGRSGVIASNEASASSGNTIWNGLDVNHQWSKSIEFERLLRAWLARHLDGTVDYVSLLRPLTELRITKAFTTHPAYFEAISSCNKNFRQQGEAEARWCRSCAKCVFVAIMARPFVDQKAYHTLFGGDPLADPENISYIEELLGLRGMKPFECVGTPDESAVALKLAKEAGRPLPHGVMTALHEELIARDVDWDRATPHALARGDEHALSPTLLGVLDGYLARH